MRRMPTTVIFEDAVASVAAEAQDEDLWLAPSDLERLGWALEPEGLCRGPLCVPIPPARRAEFVRADGAVNLAALARHRGQALVRRTRLHAPRPRRPPPQPLGAPRAEGAPQLVGLLVRVPHGPAGLAGTLRGA